MNYVERIVNMTQLEKFIFSLMFPEGDDKDEK